MTCRAFQEILRLSVLLSSPRRLSRDNLYHLRCFVCAPVYPHALFTHIQAHTHTHTYAGGADWAINLMAVPPQMDGKGERARLCSIFANLTSVERDCSPPTHAVNPHTALHTSLHPSFALFSLPSLAACAYSNASIRTIHARAGRNLKANSVCLMELVIYPSGALLI